MIDAIISADTGFGSPVMLLSVGDDPVAEAYRTSGSRAFEPASLMVWSQLAKQSAYAIDVGAFTGIYALSAANSNPRIKVAAIEPTKQVFSRLCLNIQINRFEEQIAPVNIAAGDSLGDCLLNHYGNMYCLDSGSTLLRTGHSPFWYSETVKMLPLDILATLSAYDTRGLTVIALPQTGPDIVKIDVEGYELAVLSGMRESIRRSLPILIIECLSLDALKDVHGTLAGFSYVPLLIDDQNSALLPDISRYDIGTTRNVLFYPRDKQSILEDISLK
jgi:FkbM family methyltransferase